MIWVAFYTYSSKLFTYLNRKQARPPGPKGSDHPRRIALCNGIESRLWRCVDHVATPEPADAVLLPLEVLGVVFRLRIRKLNPSGEPHGGFHQSQVLPLGVVSHAGKLPACLPAVLIKLRDLERAVFKSATMVVVVSPLRALSC